jgi:hypothetical protein
MGTMELMFGCGMVWALFNFYFFQTGNCRQMPQLTCAGVAVPSGFC